MNNNELVAQAKVRTSNAALQAGGASVLLMAFSSALEQLARPGHVYDWSKVQIDLGPVRAPGFALFHQLTVEVGIKEEGAEIKEAGGPNAILRSLGLMPTGPLKLNLQQITSPNRYAGISDLVQMPGGHLGEEDDE